MEQVEQEHPRPIATVDTVLLTLRDDRLQVALVKREADPYHGVLALPGGFVHVQEDVDLAGTAARVLRQKLGIDPIYLEQLYTFSGPVRDPRGWSISVAYYALVPESRLPEDNPAFQLRPVDDLPPLPFDHDVIVGTAMERLCGKATYSTLPAFLLEDLFTMSELQEVYELTMGKKLDRLTFRKKIIDQGIVQPVAGKKRIGQHRPAQLYTLSHDSLEQLQRLIRPSAWSRSTS